MKYNGLKKAVLNDGTHYYAYAFKQWVEVSEEVYRFLAQSERKERYYIETKAKLRMLSLDMLMSDFGEDGDDVSFCQDLIDSSPEDAIIKQFDFESEKLIARTAREAINSLYGDEYDIAVNVIIDGISLRSYAEAHSISRYAAGELYKSVCEKLRDKCRKELGGHVFDN